VSINTSYTDSEINSALQYCELILPQVSRTFAINIRVLEGELYRAVLVAYLFCRLVDTVEDSSILSLKTQADLLKRYAEIFSSAEIQQSEIELWQEMWGEIDQNDPEHSLVANCDKLFILFASLTEESQGAICGCVSEMATGMRSTLLEVRPGTSGIRALQSLEELESYCYYVAGTVGKMLTSLFIGNIPDLNDERREVMNRLDLSFALGLQLTNIIKDCATDYERGWCYLPGSLLRAAEVSPERMLETELQPRVLHVLNQLVLKTAVHLEDALEYTLAIPPSAPKIRLFNLWSLFFAIRTLVRAWDNPELLDPNSKVKIPRHEIYRTIAETREAVESDTALRGLFSLIRSRIPSTCDALS